MEQTPNHTPQNRISRLLSFWKVPEAAGWSNDKLAQRKEEGNPPEESKEMYPEESSSVFVKFHLAKGEHWFGVVYLLTGRVEEEGDYKPVSKEEEDKEEHCWRYKQRSANLLNKISSRF